MHGRFFVFVGVFASLACSADVESEGEHQMPFETVCVTVERCGKTCVSCADGEACVDGMCSSTCSSSAQCASDNPCLKPFCATGTTNACVTAYATNLQVCDGDGDGVNDDHCFGLGGCCDGCADIVCVGADCAFTCLPACPAGKACSSLGSCYMKP